METPGSVRSLQDGGWCPSGMSSGAFSHDPSNADKLLPLRFDHFDEVSSWIGAVRPLLGGNVAGHTLVTESGGFAGAIEMIPGLADALRKENADPDFILLSFGAFMRYEPSEVLEDEEDAKKLDPTGNAWNLYHGSGKKDFPVVDVMCIKRFEDGHCERQLLGKILKGMWETLDLKTEWILLG